MPQVDVEDKKKLLPPGGDKVEIHFDAPRVLAEPFKRALAVSEFSTQAQFFRFHMVRFLESRDRGLMNENDVKKLLVDFAERIYKEFMKEQETQDELFHQDDPLKLQSVSERIMQPEEIGDVFQRVARQYELEKKRRKTDGS